MIEKLCVTPLLLTTDGEHKGRIKLCNVSIQRDVTTRTVPDHKFSQVRPDRPTDERIAFQHIDCPHDVFNARARFRHLMLKEMFQDAVEVIPNFRCELDARHD
jgi:hypothetical protein